MLFRKSRLVRGEENSRFICAVCPDAARQTEKAEVSSGAAGQTQVKRAAAHRAVALLAFYSVYSERIASSGDSFMARRAGDSPETTPTSTAKPAPNAASQTGIMETTEPCPMSMFIAVESP